LLRWINLTSWLPIERRPVRTQRAVWRLTALALGRRPDVDSVLSRVIAGPAGPIELRIFSPGRSKQPLPAFLWCHGGGFLVGGLDTSESICRQVARSAGCIVVAVRYRLAPEHDLLASRQDFLAALEWAAQHGATVGIDTSRIAVGGDSAGGNICAAVAQHAARHGGPQVCLQVLAYPATDLLQTFPSKEENAKGYLVTASGLDWIARTAGVPANADDPWLSPRRCNDLRDLPPALIVSAGFDPIRDDGLDYGARLRAAGVPVQLLHYGGQFHGFLNFDALIGASGDALARIAHGLAKAFGGEPAADCTIEIAERRPAHCAIGFATSEVATTWLLGWVIAERLGVTLFGRLSPRAARAARRLLESRLAPSTWIGRHALADAGRLTARQTYPSE
jgi:acetyl esterase